MQPQDCEIRKTGTLPTPRVMADQGCPPHTFELLNGIMELSPSRLILLYPFSTLCNHTQMAVDLALETGYFFSFRKVLRNSFVSCNL